MHLLHIQHVVFLLLTMLLILTNAGMYRGIYGMRNFVFYNGLLLIAATAVMLRGAVPGGLSILGSTATFLAAYLFLLLGLEDLFGKSKPHRVAQYVLMLLGFVAVLQYGLIEPNTSRRLFLFSLILGLQQWNAAALILFRGDRSRLKSGIPMATMLILLGAGNFIRLAGVGLFGAPADYLESGIFLQSIVIATTCLQCGVIVAYVWITMALLRQDLEVQASTDALTGLMNRRAIEIAADREVLLSHRKGSRVAALAMDLDDFKQINDRYGHHCGDAVLVAVAQCLRDSLRETDFAARVGGDEFLAILPRTDAHTAEMIAEVVRDGVAGLAVPYGGTNVKVTVSIGFAELGDDISSGWDHLMARCDRAMYTDKRSGGNQVLTNPS